MKSKIFLLMVFSAALLVSCEDMIEFDPGQVDPYVVVISRPEADSLITVNMSYSRFFLDGHNMKKINDATLMLDINGSGYMASPMGDGNYLFNVSPRQGDTLTLTALVPGYDKMVSAGTRIPSEPDVQILDFIADTTSYYETYYRVRFKVNSPQNNEYYSMNILHADYVYDYETDDYIYDTTIFFKTAFSMDDPLISSYTDIEDFLDFDETGFYGEEVVFSSESFTGGSHEFTAEFYMYNYYYSGYYMYVNNDSLMKINMCFRSLSHDLYLYGRTAVESDPLSQIVSEPVQVICNINGGVGIFGASTKKTLRLPAPRYEDFHHDDYDYYYKSSKKHNNMPPTQRMRPSRTR